MSGTGTGSRRSAGRSARLAGVGAEGGELLRRQLDGDRVAGAAAARDVSPLTGSTPGWASGIAQGRRPSRRRRSGPGPPVPGRRRACRRGIGVCWYCGAGQARLEVGHVVDDDDLAAQPEDARQRRTCPAAAPSAMSTSSEAVVSSSADRGTGAGPGRGRGRARRRPRHRSSPTWRSRRWSRRPRGSDGRRSAATPPVVPPHAARRRARGRTAAGAADRSAMHRPERRWARRSCQTPGNRESPGGAGALVRACG